MENYKNYFEAKDAIQKLSRSMTLGGYEKEDIYKELESIIYLSFITRLTENPLIIKDQESIKKFFNNKSEKNGINIDQVIRNIVVYNEHTENLSFKLMYLSDDEFKELFESLEINKVSENDKRTICSVTPKEIAKLVMMLFGDTDKKSFLDICSGEGNILVEAHNNGYEELSGREINVNTAFLSKMRAAINSTSFDIKEGDVLQEKMRKEYDCVFTQPPFALRTFEATVQDENSELRYSESDRVLRADWHFIFKAINSTKAGGKTIALVTSGSLLNVPDEFYRKQIIDNKKIEMVIALPTGVMPSTTVATDILVFSDNNTNVKFVDATECYLKLKGYERRLDVDSIMNILQSNDNEKLSVVDYTELQKEGYLLDVNKYVYTESKYELKNPEPLKNYADVIPGFQYSSSKYEELAPEQGNISVVKITNIINGNIDYKNLVSINVDEEKVNKYLLKDNDILVATKGTALKFTLVEGLEERKVIPHNNMSIVRCKERLEPVYLLSFLISDTGTKLFKGIQSGTVIMNITQKAIENFQVPIVDDDTQKVIASRYNIVTKSINELKKELESAENKLQALWEEGVSE